MGLRGDPLAWGAQAALAGLTPNAARVNPPSLLLAPKHRPSLAGHVSWLQSQHSICSTDLRKNCRERKRREEVSGGSGDFRGTNLLAAPRRSQGPGAWLHGMSSQEARLVGKLGGEWWEEALAEQALWLWL